jgi:hypothetical protein
MNWVDAGAKAYLKEFGGDPKMFGKDLRTELAEEFADYYKKAMENGEYDNLKAASEDDQDEDPSQQKEAAFVNEALAGTVIAKVESALQAVSTSQSKFASSGTKDLHRISSDLRDALALGLTGRDLKARLTALADKAEYVLTHFSR